MPHGKKDSEPVDSGEEPGGVLGGTVGDGIPDRVSGGSRVGWGEGGELGTWVSSWAGGICVGVEGPGLVSQSAARASSRDVKKRRVSWALSL